MLFHLQTFVFGIEHLLMSDYFFFSEFLFYYFGWHSSGNTIWRYIFGDNSSCGNDGTTTDGNTFQYRNIGSTPNILLYHHILVVLGYLVCILYLIQESSYHIMMVTCDDGKIRASDKMLLDNQFCTGSIDGGVDANAYRFLCLNVLQTRYLCRIANNSLTPPPNNALVLREL